MAEKDSQELPEYDTLCCDTSWTRAWISSHPTCQVGSVNGNYFGSRSATHFRKLTWRNGFTWVMTPQVTSESSAWRIFLRWYMMPNTKIVPPYRNALKKHLRHRDRHGRKSGEHGTPTWKISGTQGTASFWERAEAPPPPPRPRCNFFRPKRLSPFPERLKLPFSIDVILSGYGDIVSSGTDQFTSWVKTDPDATLAQHMVHVRKAVAEFREASERRYIASSQAYRLDKNVP